MKQIRWITALLFFAACFSASAQITMETADGPVPVTIYHRDPGTGVVQDTNTAASLFGDAAPSLGYYQGLYPGLGGAFMLPFNIVGTDPSLGANTTTIPVVIVPLKIVFAGSAGSPSLDGTNVVSLVKNSPIFQNANYKAGNVDLGTTQYGDALQRAQFWNLPGFSTNYHVLLGTPTVAPTVTITVPAASGNIYALAAGGFEGVVDTNFFESATDALVNNYAANVLPIFLTDNVYLGTGGLATNCCILGYHSSQGPPAATARTWIYAAYAEPGTFSGSTVGASFVDVVPLSHEVAEWLNDPFVGSFTFGFLNFVPPSNLPQGGCIVNYETGDPLEGAPYTFSKVTNGTTYHLQDEVMLPWYLHTTSNFSVNNWTTFQNLSAVVPLVINAPSSVAGSNSNTATLPWSPIGNGVTGNVAYVGRGCPAGSISTGSPADPYLANPAGKIALIDRGSCSISLKIDAAVQGGATGVIVGLVAPGNAQTFSYGGGTNFVPSLVITQAASNSLKTALASSTVNATISMSNAIPAPPASLCSAGQ